ncbi:hypothetical protein B0H10DRAFT_2021021 [Mycena sp. CBHHK59/15]|nr:hypothetical protein B0H10DRAFT_2021021 [Mycena sp. CBHHK59/15]
MRYIFRKTYYNTESAVASTNPVCRAFATANTSKIQGSTRTAASARCQTGLDMRTLLFCKRSCTSNVPHFSTYATHASIKPIPKPIASRPLSSCTTAPAPTS